MFFNYPQYCRSSHRETISLDNKGDYDSLRQDLNTVDWAETLKGTVDKVWRRISTTILQAVETKHSLSPSPAPQVANSRVDPQFKPTQQSLAALPSAQESSKLLSLQGIMQCHRLPN